MATQETLTNTSPWIGHMLNGDFETAWAHSDLVLQERAGVPCWHLPRHFQYIWDGSSPAGKRVLVRCYHGLGDTIQFVRYMPMLKALAAEVIVWAQPELIPLLQTAEGIDKLLPLHNGDPEVAYEMDIEIMELSHMFRSTPQTLPRKIPYLHVNPAPLTCSGKFSIGIVWKAGNWDQLRAVPFELLEPLDELPGVELFIAQGAAKTAGWEEGTGTYPGELNMLEYAAFIKSLDLLITVDSMPAHLAGALGVPVWTLLHSNADWRWMKDRADSPWYPTMKLFRQPAPGDWNSVIVKVLEELKQIVPANYS